MASKDFFADPTTSNQILETKRVRKFNDNLVKRVLDLNPDDAIILHADLIPNRYPDSRTFMKRGPDVYLMRYNSLKEANQDRRAPVQLRDSAFGAIRSPIHPFYSFKAFREPDQRIRRVSLVECLEGARIYAYSHQTAGVEPIAVKPYDTYESVEEEVNTKGSEVKVTVPSRTEKSERHEMRFESVPTRDTEHKRAVAHEIASDHSCGKKRNRFGYKGKIRSSIFFCAHEIAGYLAIIDYYLHRELNMTPLEMSQFAIPTQETVDFYLKLNRNALIQGENDKKPRILTEAEKEIMLWDLVRTLGHRKTFFAEEKVKNYNWQLSA